MTVALQDLSEATCCTLDVESFIQVTIEGANESWVTIQQHANGSHGNRPVVLPADGQHAGTSQHLLLYQASFQVVGVLIGTLIQVLHCRLHVFG